MLEKKYEGIDEAVKNLNVDQYNGFQYPQIPVVASSNPDRVQLMTWGLIPSWSKDVEIRKFTLNARAETLSQKPSFKSVLNNRCLIYADGFYEWQWLDPHGQKKQKYLITLENEQPFCFAGLWSSWNEPVTGKPLHTFTLITQPANELMSRIHNSKHRMPWILPAECEADYLGGMPVCEIEQNLIAIPV